jgi:hypothetical protein
VDVVEEAMAELAIKHAAEARLRFATLDVTNLAPLEANSFDLVVEKGTPLTLQVPHEVSPNVAKIDLK